ncbi:hypothetical protein [Clostridium sp.]|uniref:hypothetical protein n=1 Tax=Clostridium sp. TaxID=1506 RepID=UPI003995A954
MSNLFFPIININNKSVKELGNFIFTYKGCKYPGGIKRIKENSSKTVKLPNSYLDTEEKLIMIYRDKSGKKKRYIIKDSFSKKDLWKMDVNVYDISDYGELEFNVAIN